MLSTRLYKQAESRPILAVTEKTSSSFLLAFFKSPNSKSVGSIECLLCPVWLLTEHHSDRVHQAFLVTEVVNLLLRSSTSFYPENRELKIMEGASSQEGEQHLQLITCLDFFFFLFKIKLHVNLDGLRLFFFSFSQS